MKAIRCPYVESYETCYDCPNRQECREYQEIHGESEQKDYNLKDDDDEGSEV